MIDAFFAWLPGNTVIDIDSIIGTLFLLLVFGGLPVWALWDTFRPQHGEHFRPIGEPAPLIAEPMERKRSPFAPKRKDTDKVEAVAK